MTTNLLAAIRCALATTLARQSLPTALVIAFAALAAPPTAYAAPSIVYDTLLPNDVGGVSFGASLEIGQTAILAGTDRYIVSFDVTLGSNLDTPFRLKFYNLDGPSDSPKSLIWESTPQIYPWSQPYYNTKVVRIDVPAVLVPDSFAWTIAPALTGDDGRISTHVGAPARVGQTGWGWDRSIVTGHMRYNPIQFVMSARILAVPEPTTGGMTLLVACGATCVRRRDRIALG